MRPDVIQIDHLTKMYGKNRGITDVSFNVQEGEIYGFIGPNGAGKTTTLRLLVGLIFPTGGSARIFGKDVVRQGDVIRADIGYLPSEVFYYENMKVIDLLRYSASFYRKDSSKRMRELAERLELDTSRKIDELSYGNKKKVGIVQGLLHSPKLIILDEPTSGLDPLMQREFFDIIREENQRGATVLFSSHILSEVQRLCHRVAIIKEGSIIRIDEVAAINRQAYKQFRITSTDLNVDDLPAAEVSDIHQDGSELSFLFRGDIDTVLKLIARHHVTDIQILEPTLEEIFMHYYE
ncbi:ABC-type multidrug transport system, ATPase component [Dehalogenimonas alkenigignens]|uniref:ABC-type multidrug transport system, ATPase component n=1 Tax=Dehalogenimonas alkenigignens TaxID=1217799 RepID=A0A0W0GKX7_9CHLR|nr:ABC transporter ATP-binding protein [Dehalogenimonas alkenigignens]KTB49205.1 ABC-type multidrug transport system, ATPase component [Dehalogenimonas alkenigignens]